MCGKHEETKDKHGPDEGMEIFILISAGNMRSFVKLERRYDKENVSKSLILE